MARRVSVSKEMILDTALKMLIRSGYASVNIKTVAAEAGCSTQPVMWHFGSMEGFRRELALYARSYAQERMETVPDGDAVSAFERMGEGYIRMAATEPNLFRFLYMGEFPIPAPFDLNDISGGRNEGIISGIADMTGLSAEAAARCIRDTVIYSHGIAVMIASGVFTAPMDKIMSMIKDVSQSFVSREKERQKA